MKTSSSYMEVFLEHMKWAKPMDLTKAGLPSA